MTNVITTNPNITARIAGFLYLLLIPLGFFGILYFPNTYYVSGDITSTIDNIVANEQAFRISVVCRIINPVVNLLLAVYLYKLLKPADKNIAIFMVVFIIIDTPVAILNELNNMMILILLNGEGYLSSFTSNQIKDSVSALIQLHEYGISMSTIFMGLWLLPMGYLIFKSDFLPKIIGVFLIIASVGYVADFFKFYLYHDLGIVFSEFTFLGEIMIMFWLLVKGVNVEEWHKQVQTS